MEFQGFRAERDDDGRRLDRVLRRFLPNLPLSAVYRLIRRGLVRVNEKRTLPEARIKEGDLLSIASGALDGSPLAEIPPKIASSIPALVELARSDDLLFLSKSAGMPTHGLGSLADLVLAREGSGHSLSFAPGPLHRLDRDTTGVIGFSLSLQGAQWFTQAIRERRLDKRYLAVLGGSLETDAEWRDPCDDGKYMACEARPLARSRVYGIDTTLALVRLITGRKRQIRLQAASRGMPLLGDARHGSRFPGPYLLHAWRLSLPDDRPAGVPAEVVAPLPDRMREFIRENYGVDTLAHLDRGDLYWA